MVLGGKLSTENYVQWIKMKSFKMSVIHEKAVARGQNCSVKIDSCYYLINAVCGGSTHFEVAKACHRSPAERSQSILV